MLSDMQSPSYTQCASLRRDIRSLGAPLDRFTMREVEKGGVRVGKERMYASPRIFTVSYVCVCVLFAIQTHTYAHSNSLKQNKTK